MSIDDFLKNALSEDIGRGDLFEICFDEDIKAGCKIVSKDSGVLAGVKYIKRLAKICDIEIKFFLKDGDRIESGVKIANAYGSYRELLKLERTMLNILQHASGIATNCSDVVSSIGDFDIKILDTRKTRPLLRELEKYASRIGGAHNHRMGLDDCLMLKDTHLKHIKDIKGFITEARKRIPFTSKIEMECESVDLAKIALESKVDILMCDNMSLEEIEECVKLRNDICKDVLVEVSGNIKKEDICSIAKIGVDAISMGSLIHQSRWLDISMKML